jgi:hypothetical protein
MEWISLEEKTPIPETTVLFWFENSVNPHWRQEKIGHIERNAMGGYKIYVRGGWNPIDGWRATHFIQLLSPPKNN